MTHTDWLALLSLGNSSAALDPWEAIARAAIVYVATLALIRVGKKRFLGRGTPFDVVIAVVIGSIAARAIVAGSPIIPSLAAMAALIGLHWLFSLLAMRWRWFGFLVKGRNRVLVRDGVIDWDAMCHEHLSVHDLEEDMRERGFQSIEQVDTVRIERNGKLSFIAKR